MKTLFQSDTVIIITFMFLIFKDLNVLSSQYCRILGWIVFIYATVFWVYKIISKITHKES